MTDSPGKDNVPMSWQDIQKWKVELLQWAARTGRTSEQRSFLAGMGNTAYYSACRRLGINARTADLK